jgi:hypothetical protein
MYGLSFSKQQIEKILRGEKFQASTKCDGRPLRVGKVYHLCQERIPVGRVRITNFELKKLGEYGNEEDLRAEGYSSMDEFKEAWLRFMEDSKFNPEQEIYVYKFEVING